LRNGQQSLYFFVIFAAMSVTILGIESSCDDTSAAVVRDEYLLSNVIAGQEVHRRYGGVVPELASRAHQQNIVPVVDAAIKDAGISKSDIDAIAFTRGPGLMGALLVGASFAKGFALARKIPLLDVNHLHGHLLVHFLKENGSANRHPSFPFLCLLVSGGHTQIIRVTDYLKHEILGQTIDDAAGEAFDKAAKVMGLSYPGGPVIDKLAAEGNEEAFYFSKPQVPGLDFSFSGLKTSFLYFLRDSLKQDPLFIEKHKKDLCASLQRTIVDMLMEKLVRASQETGIREIVLGGGVSANSALRKAALQTADKHRWNVFLPPLRYTTDNAAMIAITGYYKYKAGLTAGHDVVPDARMYEI